MGIGDIAKGTFNAVKDVGEGAVDVVTGVGGAAIDVVTDAGGAAVDVGAFGEPTGEAGHKLGAGSAAVGAIAPCAFRLDVQWILDIVDKIQTIITKVETVARNVLAKAQKVLDKLGGILSWFCWMPGGKFAKDFVERMCWLIDKAVAAISRIYGAVLEAMKHVLAPWEVRSAGEQIRDDLAPKYADFSQMLHPGNLRSASSWTGSAAEAFRSSLQRQFDTSQEVAGAAKAFGAKVQEIGADGVKTTVTFTTGLVTAIGGIIASALSMAAIPVGTAVGAGAVIGLVAKVFALIMVYVTAMMQIIRQSSELGNAASSVPGGQWPVARI